ncbi:LytR/AlgR family response regulator transcription factor [Ornithobacterium rhinotracheale]|uniref:LytR/AlgR family response regulator transcription factor n=3 Tax=Ornithobacterium rhinotracheale TaxID=28251 RepID=UPI00129C69C2|nr:LytTR family DNA-binding domain-containing protein [Ornithobacterium rhinotracheale]MCK0205127.1 LytTR family DNA-binding domain-containing protein [Ornithobacterium rhinotracheale]MRJ07559.1 DNA-binding response regulator [Ornithobacterium rhinotracheale]UOH78155.1 LytTR family DNA-binding domain-containing protein [Ornithobacterium rhinotracheale]UVD88103.1 LytTR family DNA-binding domain-containing protein [Ornithobacterium rhinotracheale]
MNAIIIEDEAVAARHLKSLAEKQGAHILCSLQSVKESIEWLKTHPSPELIFLDVQLGDGLSFEIFEHIQPQSVIIFTTAYSEYALRAFKLNSIDYLLKPINETELANALAKYRQQKQKEFFDFNTIQAFFNQYSNNYKERFLVQIGQELKSFLTEEISMFYSEEKTTFLVYKNREYPIDFSLSELEKSLNPQLFFRVSRQAIVHRAFIENIYSYSGNRLRLKIKHAQGDWIVSRERVLDFKNWLA